MQLKGYGKDLVFFIDLEEDLNNTAKEIETILNENWNFFAQNPINLKFNRDFDPVIDSPYVNALQKIFLDKGLVLNNFNQKIIEIENLINPTYVRWKSIRAGSTITISDGNLVLFGDVNPSAKVEVAGFLMCKGTIKGIVHAGYTLSKDDNIDKSNIFVYADRINSPRIQLGDKIAYNVKEKGAVISIND